MALTFYVKFTHPLTPQFLEIFPTEKSKYVLELYKDLRCSTACTGESLRGLCLSLIRGGLSVPRHTWATAQLGQGFRVATGRGICDGRGDEASQRKMHTCDPAAVITQKPYL